MMMSTPGGNAPPRSVWIATAITVLIMLIGSHLTFECRLYLVKKIRKQSERNENPQRIAKTSPLPEADVYVLGSSFVRRGLDPEPLRSVFHDLDPAHDRFCFHTEDAMGIDRMTILFHEALKYHPRTIVLESNLICNDNYHPVTSRPILTRTKKLVMNHQRRLEKLLVVLFHSPERLFDAEVAEQKESQAESPCSFDTMNRYWIEYSARVKQFRVRQPEELQEMRTAILQAVDQGIDVILIEFPRSATSTSYLSLKFLNDYEQLVRTLEDTYPVSFLSSAAFPRDDRLFMDAVHLNEEGKAAFTAWVIGQLVRHPSQQETP